MPCTTWSFVTFTHVFFDNEKHGKDKTTDLARDKLGALNAAAVPFADAPKHGDRFPYHVNYVERTPDYVASHFGAEMAEAVFALAASDKVGHGPYVSPYGAHLVMVVKSEAGRTPSMDDVRTRVVQDAQRAKQKELADEAVRAIIETYNVRVDYAPGSGE